jgi:hypothetical protein
VFTAQLAANAQGLLAPVAGTGDSFADFLLGYPTNGMVTGLPVVQFRATQVTPFFGTWRGHRLHSQLRVSWFFETPPAPQGWRDLVHPSI